MKVVGVIGSYRKGHITDQAVSAVLAGTEAVGAQTEKLYLIDKHIEFCTNCRKCAQQESQAARTVCIHDDDMAEILDLLDSADALVLGSPVNFFDVTAITRRFIERLLVYVYWPWGAAVPKPRVKKMIRKAVVITASAAPAWLARLLMRSPVRILKRAAKLMGAGTTASIHIGLAALTENQNLTEKQRLRAEAAGRKLVA